MATIATLEGTGRLVRIEIELDGRAQPWRCLYGTPDFIEWLDRVLPNMKTTVVGGEIEPLEQVDAIFHEYVSGEHMDADRRFKKLTCTPDHFVWELKTLDVRIFGWVPVRDHFICTYGDHKDQIELLRKYGRYIAQTVYVRNQCDLQPNHIAHEEYEYVLSDAN